MDFHSRRQQDALIVSSTRTGGASVVSVGGEVDVYTAPRLRAELDQVLDETPDGPVFLDLTAVTFISSAGLAVLVDAHAQAGRSSRPFGLVVDHFAAAVIRTLETAGLTGLFASYSDVAESIARSE
jgi:anti-sigma B factor antagonist